MTTGTSTGVLTPEMRHRIAVKLLEIVAHHRTLDEAKKTEVTRLLGEVKPGGSAEYQMYGEAVRRLLDSRAVTFLDMADLIVAVRDETGQTAPVPQPAPEIGQSPWPT